MRVHSNLKIVAISFLILLGVSACDKSTDNKNSSEVDNNTVSSQATAANTAIPAFTPTPAPTATLTPIPVQRKDVRITGFMIGKGVDKQNNIKNPTSQYHSGDSIYGVVRTSGSGPEATIKVRCKDGSNNIIFEESKKIMPKGSNEILFTFTSAKDLKAGVYRLESLLDEYPNMGVSVEVSN